MGKSLFEKLIRNIQYIIVGSIRNFTSNQIRMSNLRGKNVKIMITIWRRRIDIGGDFNEIIFINNAGTISPINKKGVLGNTI